MSRVHVPSRFRRSPRTQARRSRRAFAPGGPGARLTAELGGEAYLYSLTVTHLDPSVSDDPGGRFVPATVNALFAAGSRLFSGPFFMVLEPGRGDVFGPDDGALHPHIVGHRNDGPRWLERDTARARWVYDPPGLYRYLHKHEPLTLEGLGDYAAAQVLAPTGRAPRIRRHFFSQERSAWLRANALSLTFGPPPEILPCGRCKGRHLPGCPSYRAAAAAAARNEARSQLSGHFDGWGFADAALPSEGRIFVPSGYAAAAAAAASSPLPARETAHEAANARAPLPPALLRRVQARRRHRRKARTDGQTGLPNWLKKRVESRSQTANPARDVVQ